MVEVQGLSIQGDPCSLSCEHVLTGLDAYAESIDLTLYRCRGYGLCSGSRRVLGAGAKRCDMCI